MRIPVNYSRYHFDLKGDRLGTIHIALRRGQAPRNHAYIEQKKIFEQYPPADADDLQRWSQYLKRNYPELNHASPTSS